MADATFTFRVETELKNAFAEAAKAQDRTAAQLLRVLMRDAVRRRHEARIHDSWFRDEVEQAMREADDPNVRRIPHQAVRANWRRKRAKLAKGARGKTA